MKTFFILTLSLVGVSTAQAASIDQIDLPNLSFDLQSSAPLAPPVTNSLVYSGEAGLMGSEIGFSVAAFSPLTDLASTVNFNIGPPVNTVAYEHVHVGNFTIDFDAPITSLLIYAQNDNFDSLGIDLGFAPSDFGGTTVQTGTQFSVNTSNSGMFLLYEFLVPTSTVTNISAGPGRGGGFDMAFFPNVITAPVPLPASIWFIISGIGGFTAIRRFFKPGRLSRSA